MGLLYDLYKTAPIKSVSLTTLIFLVLVAVVTVKAGDYRYLRIANGEQIQRTLNEHEKNQLKTQIFVLDLKAGGATQEQIDAALLKRYKTELEDIKENEPD